MPTETAKTESSTAPAVVAVQQESAAPQQKTEAAPPEPKPATPAAPEPAKQADPAPQAAELKLPEGVEVDKAFLEKAKAAWKDAGVPVEQQQKTLDLYASHVAEQNKAFEESQKKQRDEWRAAVKADPEMGGAKFDASSAKVAKAADKFFGEDGRKLLDLTGLGDHPVIFKALYKIGTLISEDSIAGSVAEAQKTTSNPLDAIYDHPTSRARLK